MLKKVGVAMVLLALAAPLSARSSLGMFSDWGAFRDPKVPRCYAIAKAQPSSARREHQAYASVGSWPRRAIRGQIHFRLSRNLGERPAIQLALGDKRFELTGSGSDASFAQLDTLAPIETVNTGILEIDFPSSNGNPFESVMNNDAALTVDDHAARFTGQITVATTQNVSFFTNSDDGSILWVDLNNDGDFNDANEEVVDNRGQRRFAGAAFEDFGSDGVGLEDSLGRQQHKAAMGLAVRESHAVRQPRAGVGSNGAV